MFRHASGVHSRVFGFVAITIGCDGLGRVVLVVVVVALNREVFGFETIGPLAVVIRLLA
jgi:hypothetical protein